MTLQANHGNGEHDGTGMAAEPRELRSLYIPDEHVEYPDTPEWRSLGPHVRRTADRRRAHAERRILGLRLLSLAACLVGVLAVVWVLAGNRETSGPGPLAAGTEGAGTSVVAGRDALAPGAVSDEATELETLVTRLELDYIALQLTELGIAAAGDPGGVDRVLASYDIDAVQYHRR